MDNPLLALRGISFGYPSRQLFSDLNLSIGADDHIGLYGVNGSGKTTLLRLATGLLRPSSGGVFLHGREVVNADDWHTLRCEVGFVLQDSEDQLFSPIVIEDVAFGPLNLGMERDAARERAMAALRQLGIEGLAERSSHQLSGGEKKMVAIATVLSMHPQAMLMDEPTIFLDERSQERIVRLLQEQPLPRLVVSHDMTFLKKVSNRLLALSSDGTLAEVEPR